MWFGGLCKGTDIPGKDREVIHCRVSNLQEWYWWIGAIYILGSDHRSPLCRGLRPLAVLVSALEESPGSSMLWVTSHSWQNQPALWKSSCIFSLSLLQVTECTFTPLTKCSLLGWKFETLIFFCLAIQLRVWPQRCALSRCLKCVSHLPGSFCTCSTCSWCRALYVLCGALSAFLCAVPVFELSHRFVTTLTGWGSGPSCAAVSWQKESNTQICALQWKISVISFLAFYAWFLHAFQIKYNSFWMTSHSFPFLLCFMSFLHTIFQWLAFPKCLLWEL